MFGPIIMADSQMKALGHTEFKNLPKVIQLVGGKI